MRDGQGILLDFDSNAALEKWASNYSARIKYVSGAAKNQLGVSALLIRPDGFVAWAADHNPACSELQQAAARWFVGTISKR